MVSFDYTWQAVILDFTINLFFSLIITKIPSAYVFLGCHGKMHSEVVSYYYCKVCYLKKKTKPVSGTWMEIVLWVHSGGQIHSFVFF